MPRPNRKTRIRLEAIEAYGGKCSCCGHEDITVLCFDHINGGGNAERRIDNVVQDVVKLAYRLKREGYPKDKFQLLCRNCNWAKGTKSRCPCESGTIKVTISDALAATPRHRTGCSPKIRVLDDTTVIQARILRAEGLTYKAISEKLGYNPSTLAYAIRRGWRSVI